MDIKYKEKPTETIINNYTKKIEGLLSVHNLSLIINVNDFPSITESYMNGQISDRENWWLGDVFIKIPKTGKVKIKLPRSGIDADLKKEDVWGDAYDIQDQMYKNLKISPGDPFNENDPYWNLWNYLKND